MEKYSRGRRGAPAKGVGRIIRGARVQISPSPPTKRAPKGVLFSLAGKDLTSAPRSGMRGSEPTARSARERKASEWQPPHERNRAMSEGGESGWRQQCARLDELCPRRRWRMKWGTSSGGNLAFADRATLSEGEQKP